MMPPLPARFSMITACCQRSLSFCATVRVMASVAPPGGNGTTILTVLLGYAATCASASCHTRVNEAPAMIHADIERANFMSPPQAAIGLRASLADDPTDDQRLGAATVIALERQDLRLQRLAIASLSECGSAVARLSPK